MTGPFQRGSFELEGGSALRYSVFAADPETARRKPIILGLHPGWGGRLPSANYGELFLSSLFAPALGETGALIVAPDCPAPAWNHLRSKAAILELIARLKHEHRIETAKTTLVGYSAGGWGAWYMLLEDPEAFNAVVTLATLPVMAPVEHFEQNFEQVGATLSARREEWLGRVPEVPLWILHSRDDEVFPFQDAERGFQALSEHGKDVEFCPVDGVGHFDSAGYVQGLRGAVSWLERRWSAQV